MVMVAEDPVIWFSGGQYHVLYDYAGDRVGYHLTSTDGIHNWTDQGLAYDPRYAQQIFSYTDGTVDYWFKMERPSVLVENGLITHVTFAVADVNKDNQIPAGSNHGSKVIVVPFDSVAFDKDTGGSGGGGTGGGGGSGGTAGAGAGGLPRRARAERPAARRRAARLDARALSRARHPTIMPVPLCSLLSACWSALAGAAGPGTMESRSSPASAVARLL